MRPVYFSREALYLELHEARGDIYEFAIFMLRELPPLLYCRDAFQLPRDILARLLMRLSMTYEAQRGARSQAYAPRALFLFRTRLQSAAVAVAIQRSFCPYAEFELARAPQLIRREAAAQILPGRHML